MFRSSETANSGGFSDNEGSTSRIEISDLAAIVVLSLTGLMLRVWKQSALGLTHFDEGVYANSAFAFLPTFFGPGLDPWQKLFSPPGYFSLVGLAYRIVGGPSDCAAIGINIAVGAAIPGFVYWMGKRWFGRAAGMFSAALVTFSEFEIAYSRTALTDTLFSFLFLLSLALTAICLEKRRWTYGIAAGLAIGATWNVKYHGWLPLAIAFVVIVIRVALKREERGNARILFSLWGLAALTAFLCVAPWLWYTELHLGGYREVEVFHRRFADYHWPGNAIRYAQMQLYFEGWLSRIAAAVALVAACVYRRKVVQTFAFPAGLLLLLCSGFVFGGAGTLLVLSLLGLGLVWSQKEFLGQLAGVTFMVFTILTPLYTPYARLLLPWMATAQLLGGVAIARFAVPGSEDEMSKSHPEFRSGRLAVVVGAAVVIVISGAIFGLRKNHGSAWSDRSGDRASSAQAMSNVPKDGVVFVVGEPQVCFYFRQAGYRAFCVHRLGLNGIAPDPLLYATKEPIFVVGGKYARDDPTWRGIQEDQPGRFTALGRFYLRPGDIRLLDDLPTSEVEKYMGTHDSRYDLELLRVNRTESNSP